MLESLGIHDEALEVIQTAVRVSGRHQYALMMSAWIQSVNDGTTGAQSILDELISRSSTEYISAFSLAIAAWYAGNQEQSLAFMERAFDERACLIPAISGYPFLSFIKTNPAFHHFLQRIAYPEGKVQGSVSA